MKVETPLLPLGEIRCPKCKGFLGEYRGKLPEYLHIPCRQCKKDAAKRNMRHV